MPETTMPKEAAALRPPPAETLRVHTRVRHGLKRPHNWIQLTKFVAVGGTGYVVNLAVFAVCIKVVGIHHLAAATAAFLVAVVNNFWWNRHWTFGAREGIAGTQAARFFTVSIVAFLFQAAILQLLVSAASVPTIVAQAISLIAATPLNFIGNKLWSFARPARHA
jgi:putative flippase GtrA